MFRESGAAKIAGRHATRSDTVFYPQPNHTLVNAPSEADAHQLKYIPSIGVEVGILVG